MQELIHRREHGERKRGRWRSLDIARGRLLAAVSVNLSTRTLEVKEFDSAWLYATLQRDIRHLADYGLRLAADDVGAGNAGLRLLSQVPFDILKREMSLVQEAARNTVTWAVLRSLRDLARRQEAVVIGEGVETPE